MSHIDWSKAPKDATHFHPKMNGYAAHWIKDGFFCREGNEHGGWVVDANPQPLTNIIGRPIEWTVEGLPPVGVTIEFRPKIGEKRDWAKCEVKYVGAKFLVIREGDDEGALSIGMYDLRPIRTPEQIAAEERQKTIDELKSVFDSVSHELCPTSNQYLETLFGAIHDASYRKFEIVENEK